MCIKTFVFFDLETTGLRTYKYAAKITEMCLVAVNRCHLTSNTTNQTPRILNKLNLCFYPNKIISPEVTQMTGMCNFSLEKSQPFSILSADLIENFLKHQESPICLVAHNGNKFDFLILNDELEKVGKKLSDEIVCVDSLPAFREIFNPMDFPREAKSFEIDLLHTASLIEQELDASNLNIEHVIKQQQLLNETTPTKPTTSICKRKGKNDSKASLDTVDASAPTEPKARKRLDFDRKRPVSYKLCDIYKFIFNQDMPHAHQAENDVYALMKSCCKVDKQFLKYADENRKPFNQFRYTS